VLQEFGGDLGYLGEASSIILEFSDGIDCIINSVDSIVKDDCTSVVGLGISFSGIIEETNMIGHGCQNIIDGSMSSFSLSFEDVGGFKDSVGRLKNTVGI